MIDRRSVDRFCDRRLGHGYRLLIDRGLHHQVLCSLAHDKAANRGAFFRYDDGRGVLLIDCLVGKEDRPQDVATDHLVGDSREIRRVVLADGSEAVALSAHVAEHTFPVDRVWCAPAPGERSRGPTSREDEVVVALLLFEGIAPPTSSPAASTRAGIGDCLISRHVGYRRKEGRRLVRGLLLLIGEARRSWHRRCCSRGRRTWSRRATSTPARTSRSPAASERASSPNRWPAARTCSRSVRADPRLPWA